MQALMDYARSEGVEDVYGLVHVDNRLMLKMANELGFETHQSPGDASVLEIVWHPGDVQSRPLRRAG
jgi:acetyltransferase